MKLNMKLLFTSGTVLAGVLIAVGIIMLVMKGGTAYTKKLQDEELKNTIAIEDTLTRTQAVIESGNDITPCISMMEKIANKTMLSEQKLKYNILWGDIYIIRYRNTAQEKIRQIFYNRAVKQYNIAAQLAPTPEVRGSLYRRNAALHMEAGEWREALDLFQNAYTLVTNPVERWGIDLAMANCYLKCKMPDRAVLQLDKAIASDNDDIWAAAMLAKADIYLKALTDQGIRDSIAAALSARDRDLAEAQKNRRLPAYCELRASELYRDVAERIPKVSRYYSEAQLGLIRLAVVKRDGPEAYRLANRLMSGPSGKDDRVKAILLLAELEENRERYQDAIGLIKKALEKYPIEASRVNTGLRLYNLYKKIKNWDAAFSIARNLFQQSSDPEAICRLIDDFSSGKNMIFDIIVNSSDREFYLKQLLGIFAAMEVSHPVEWRQIKVNAYYVLAQLYYACGDYANAAKSINQCYLNSDHPDNIEEKILRLDFRCAIKSKAPKSVIICRASRYLNHYPHGEIYREVLLHLLRCYCDTQLYQPALLIARKIYADELDSFSDRNKKADELWMETIAVIAECYYRLGEFDKAAKLIRNFARQLLNEQYGPKIYYTWAGMAIDKQQEAEAIRRLGVALMYNPEHVVKLKLQVAQSLLLIKSGSLKDFYDAAGLLRSIMKDPELSQTQRDEYQRVLSEALLNYSMEYGMTKDFDLLLGNLIKKDSSRLWCQYWVLKALTPAFQTASLQTLNRKHEEILQSEYLKIIKDQWTQEFIRDQLVLIRSLIGIEERMDKLKNKG